MDVFALLAINFCVNFDCNGVVVDIKSLLDTFDFVIFWASDHQCLVKFILIRINCKIVSSVISKTINSDFIDRKGKYVRTSHFDIRESVSDPSYLLDIWIGSIKVFNSTLIFGVRHITLGYRSNQEGGIIAGVVFEFHLRNLIFLQYIISIICLTYFVDSFIVKICTEHNLFNG